MKIKDPNPPSYQYISKPHPQPQSKHIYPKKYNFQIFDFYTDIKNFLFPFLRK